MIKLSTTVDSELLEPLEAYFYESEDPTLWSFLQEKPTDPHTLQACFQNEAEAMAQWEALRVSFPQLSPTPSLDVLEDKDWKDAYKAYLKPWNCEDLHWVPVWMRDEVEIPQGHHALYLDAGMAFGTGTHETTQLCARRLLEYRDLHREACEQLEVIDAGCGSGILALSAKLLGFKKIFAFDYDADSIRVAKENAQSNGEGDLDLVVADLVEGLKSKKADLLLANIETPILTRHAEILVNAVKAKGWLVLSGILTHEEEVIESAFVGLAQEVWPEGCRFESRIAGEWTDFVLMRG